MEFQEVLARFDRPKAVAGGYNVTCPCHDDNVQSLTISKGDNGGIILHCHAGCDTKLILQSVGLSYQDIAPPKSVSAPAHATKQEVVYPYHDRHGQTLFEVVRIDDGHGKKSFRQRQPLPNGGYNWSIKGIEVVPYRLPEIVQAISVGKPVLIVEGEKDADNLRRLGFTATTNAGGAKNWKVEHTEALRGANVYLFSDNDKPGHERVEHIARELDGVASGIWVVDLLSVMPDLPKKGDISDVLKAKGNIVQKLIDDAEPYDGSLDAPDDQGRGSQANRLLVTCADIEFFLSDMNEAHALVNLGGYMDNLPLSSDSFSNWLRCRHYEKTREIVGRDSLQSVCGLLAAKEQSNTQKRLLFNRIAPITGGFLYDMMDEKRRAIEISAQGWKVIDQERPPFCRYKHQKPIPEPIHGGDVRQLLEHINVPPSRQMLFLCYVVALFIPDIAHRILVIHGDQGAAKTTTTKMLKALVDPSELDTMAFPDGENLSRILRNHWLPCFDNMSSISSTQSDALCRAATGDCRVERKLYTNDGEVVYKFKRPIILNGINAVTTRPDLMDRSLFLGLERLPNNRRLTETEVWSRFYADLPGMLGGIFDVLSRAIAIEPSVKLAECSRMADFDHWGAAIAEALQPGGAALFIEQIKQDEERRTEETLYSDTVASSILHFMEGRNFYDGTAAELLTELRDIAIGNALSIHSQAFPQSPNSLSRRINRIRSSLEGVGIRIENGRTGIRRSVKISRNRIEGVGNASE